MLLHSTDTAAPASLRPGDMATVLSGRHSLVLAPATSRGWFGGTPLVAWEPIETRAGLDLAEAGASLQATFEGAGPALTALLAPYDGPCIVVHYGGGLTLGQDGWVPWGEVPELPAVEGCGAGVRQGDAPSLPLLADARADATAREYRAGVRDVCERIAAGDVYVLNLTYRIRGRAVLEPAQALAALLDRAGSDFSALLELPDGAAVASVSPERFLRVRDEDGTRTAEIWPIKGTRPRGATAELDAALARELLEDAKERAEHLMIVDLERNDLGRVCVPGTVRVDPLYEVVPTPYCHQLVSTVRGELRAEAGFGEVLEATFPCGSVTGAPKIAAMCIIEEIEPSQRGAYCGALLVARPGEMDSSVLIRTLEYERDRPRTYRAGGLACAAGAAGEAGTGTGSREACWGTGGGITIESDPAAEWLESLLKASPVIGDGAPAVTLLETCRVAFGRVPLLDRHLARLAAGGCGPSLLAVVRARIASALGAVDAASPYARLRILVHPDRLVEAVADSRPSTLAVNGGVVLAPHVVQHAPHLPEGAAKPAERTVWDEAHAAAVAKGGHQAVLVLPDGTLVDGSTSTIWVRIGDRLLTPAAPPAVDGVGRGVVFDLAHELGYRAEEATLHLQDLDGADEVFLSNALAGVVALRGRDGRASTVLGDVFSWIWDAGAHTGWERVR